MEYQEEFKFLNFETIKRKNADELKEEDRVFLKLNLLDKNFNPCYFFVFNKDLMRKLLDMQLVGLQVLDIKFEVSFSNNSWNVKALDVNE